MVNVVQLFDILFEVPHSFKYTVLTSTTTFVQQCSKFHLVYVLVHIIFEYLSIKFIIR